MRVVSFDVAIKSLAVAVVDVKSDELISKQIYKLFREYKKKKYSDCVEKLEAYTKLLLSINVIMNDRFQIHYLTVKDLIPGRKIKDVKAVETAYLLYIFLEEIRAKITHNYNDEYRFIIEYQMAPNDKTRGMSSQLLLYCMSFFKDNSSLENVWLIGPSLKNKLSIASDNMSKHSYYTEKYRTNYAANKNHTKYIMQRMLQLYDQKEKIKDIKKKNLDDIADAICMILIKLSNL